jgi:PDZ domain-containing protein
MQRRSVTFGVATIVLIASLVVAFLLHVPYVILSPGPLTDTLGPVPTGEAVSGQPVDTQVINITGATVQPASSGHLYLTTVSITPGSCSSNPSFFQTLKAWWKKDETVEPKQVECPPGTSSAAVQQQGEQEMSDSQINAVYAAMSELGYKPTGTRVIVSTISASAPAAKVLQLNDQILSINGTAVTGTTQLINAVRQATAGSILSLGIDRAGKQMTLSVPTIKGTGGKTMIGITLGSAPTYQGISVTVGIDPESVGGPSAGTALALGIIDKLTPGGLTGGRTIAGTGEITKTGKIGPIGGIQQKIAAAAHAHATVFFAPSSECADAKAVAPKSMTLIRGSTLAGVVTALKDIKAGNTNFPHC